MIIQSNTLDIFNKSTKNQNRELMINSLVKEQESNIDHKLILEYMKDWLTANYDDMNVSLDETKKVFNLVEKQKPKKKKLRHRIRYRFENKIHQSLQHDENRYILHIEIGDSYLPTNKKIISTKRDFWVLNQRVISKDMKINLTKSMPDWKKRFNYLMYNYESVIFKYKDEFIAERKRRHILKVSGDFVDGFKKLDHFPLKRLTINLSLV